MFQLEMPDWLVYKFRSLKALSQHWEGWSVCAQVARYQSSEDTSRKASVGNWCLPSTRCSVSMQYSVYWSLPGLKGLSSLRFSLSQTRHSIILGIYQPHSVFCHLIKDFPSLPEHFHPLWKDVKGDCFSEDILKSQSLMFVCKTGIIWIRYS